MLELNAVHQGDCLELMDQIEDKSIDLVLTDPPYGVNLEYESYDDTEDNWYNLMTKALPQIIRISTMAILPSCKIARMEWIYKNFPPDWLICWFKGSPGVAAFVGFNDWEPHLVYGKNKGVQMHDYFKAMPNERMGEYGHPCPKPLEWAMWLISRATKPGDIVCDPFAGSGTTGVACKKLGRRFILIEQEAKYVKIAKERLDATMEPLIIE